MELAKAVPNFTWKNKHTRKARKTWGKKKLQGRIGPNRH